MCCAVGLGKQGKRKARDRSVDMALPAESKPDWVPPPPDECEEEYEYVIAPADADMTEHRLHWRVVTHRRSGVPVDFNVTYLTFDRGRWRTVTRIDTDHGTVHCHRFSRHTGDQVGDPEVFQSITCLDDCDTGYDLACRVMDAWQENLQRWRHA